MHARQGRGDELSRLVYKILVTEKRRPIREIAAAIGMEYASFHARVIGRTHFKAEEMSRLIREVPDPRLCDYLLRNTQFVAVPRPAPTMNPTLGVFQAAVHLATESLATVEHVGETLAGAEAGPIAFEHLSAHVQEAERAVSNLRASLLSLMPGSSRPADPMPSKLGVKAPDVLRVAAPCDS
jgi:hypothetical protein